MVVVVASGGFGSAVHVNWLKHLIKIYPMFITLKVTLIALP